MKYYASMGDRTALVERSEHGVSIDDAELRLEFETIGPGDLHIRFGDRSVRAVGERTPEGWRISIAGREYHVALEGERARAIRELTGREESTGPSDLRAPMPGLVIKVLVEPGQPVRAGEGLMVVEAMKMENELRAGADGVVDRIEVAPGQAVERDDLLITFDEAGT